ncbi:MAG: alpha/beta hydrolase, partial [SAR324 cluster bacterium]|nr:alpha/beta hydrolase [SAR324 cluster bacterium]
TQGPKLILLHGLLGQMSNWEAVTPCFARFSRPHAVQFPLLTGHKTEVKVNALCLYTEYYIRKYELAPVTLCGNSLGGHVALRLAIARPELVDCLILSGASGLYEHSVDALPVRPDKNYITTHMKRVFYDPKFTTPEAVEDIYRILSSRGKVLNLIQSARSAKRDNVLSDLKDIKAPTLLLWGENDLITTMDVGETFHKAIPHSKLVTIGKCGHAPMIEHPQWFSDEVEKFLKEHSLYFNRQK